MRQPKFNSSAFIARSVARSASAGIALVVATLALLFAPACGGDFEQVTTGNIECTEPCAFEFPPAEAPRISFDSVTIANDGNGELIISDMYIEGSSDLVRFQDQFVIRLATVYDIDWNTDGTGHGFVGEDDLIITAENQIQIDLEFAPSSAGAGCDPASCGDLVIISNDRDPEDRETRIPITMSVNSGRISVSPTVITFPVPVVGATYNESFEIRNVGQGTLQITDVDSRDAIPGLTFVATSGETLPFFLSANSAATIGIEYRPETTDALATSIQVRSTDPSQSTVLVNLSSGGGGLPDAEVDPTELAFGDVAVGQTEEILFDVTNVGQGVLTWALRLGDVTPTSLRTAFSIQTSAGEVFSDGTPLASGNAETLKLVYVASTEESVQGNLTLTGNFGRTITIPFSAGPPAACIDVVPPQLFWGNVDAGVSDERFFVVYNCGNANLEISGLSFVAGNLSGEFSVDTTGPLTIPVGESQLINVTYARMAGDVETVDQATLEIASNAAGAESYNITLIAEHDETLLPPTCVVDTTPAEPFSVGQSVTLDASQSVASAGELQNNPYRWSVDGPSGSTARISPDFGTSVTFEPDQSGNYTIGLTVTATVSGSSVQSSCTRSIVVN